MAKTSPAHGGAVQHASYTTKFGSLASYEKGGVQLVADVLAQIRALVVGATPELVDAPPRPDRTVPPPTVFYGS